MTISPFTLKRERAKVVRLEAMREKKVHAIDWHFMLFCGQRGGNRTSIVRKPYSRDRLAKLVTCKRCLKIMRGSNA